MGGHGGNEIGFGKGHSLSFVLGIHNNARSGRCMCASDPTQDPRRQGNAGSWPTIGAALPQVGGGLFGHRTPPGGHRERFRSDGLSGPLWRHPGAADRLDGPWLPPVSSPSPSGCRHGDTAPGPLVVLVHGSLDRSASFARVVRRLDDVHTVVYDRGGYHRSRQAGAHPHHSGRPRR